MMISIDFYLFFDYFYIFDLFKTHIFDFIFLLFQKSDLDIHHIHFSFYLQFSIWNNTAFLRGSYKKRRRKQKQHRRRHPRHRPRIKPIVFFGYGNFSWQRPHGSVPTKVNLDEHSIYCFLLLLFFLIVNLKKYFFNLFFFFLFCFEQSLARELAVEQATVVFTPERGTSSICCASTSGFEENIFNHQIHHTQPVHMVQPRCDHP